MYMVAYVNAMINITATVNVLLLLLSRNIVVLVPKNSDGADDALGIADGMNDGESEGMVDIEGVEEGCADGAVLRLGFNEG